MKCCPSRRAFCGVNPAGNGWRVVKTLSQGDSFVGPLCACAVGSHDVAAVPNTVAGNMTGRYSTRSDVAPTR